MLTLHRQIAPPEAQNENQSEFSGSIASGLDRAATAPVKSPEEGKIGRRGSLSFQVVATSSPGMPPAPEDDAAAALRSLSPDIRSKSPYVLRASLNSSPSPPKRAVRRDPSEPLPRIGRVLTGGWLNPDMEMSPLGGHHLRSFTPAPSPSEGDWAHKTASDVMVKRDAWGEDNDRA